MYVLGIETSCDETAVAILDYTLVQHGLYSNHNLLQKTTEREKNQTKILSNIVYSQIKEHSPFGGVVPEIAARKHVVLLDELIKEALFQADLSMNALDLIAVTRGPGLVGGLMVGLMSAKALSIALNIPFIGVNHLEGHALTARLSDSVSYPYLLLLVSGGHSQIIFVEGLGSYQRIGSTIDDALGEAFDKTAKLMGLPYPGGPYVEQYAKNGDAKRFAFPRPLAKDPRIAFSFSGLKTAVRQTILKLQDDNKKQNKGGEYFLTEQDICDLCASFQAAILDVLEIKLEKSFCLFKEKYPNFPFQFVIAGGVGANLKLRERLNFLCAREKFTFFAPPLALCTDNAAMIAFAGAEHFFMQNHQSSLDLAPRSRWPLDENSKAIFGEGRRGAKV